MGWPLLKLADLCEVLDSRRKPITKKDRVEGPYPYYGATGILSYVDDFIFDEPLVLVGEDGAKWGAGDNSAFRIEGKTWVNNHAHVIRPLREKVLDQWLVYYLNGHDLSDFITGMTVPKLNQGKLKEIPIPLPPTPEQKRIVAILDEAFAAIDKARELTERNLQNARDLFDSYLNQIFTQKGDEWETKTVGDIADSYLGKMLDKKKNKGTPEYYLRNVNVRWFDIDTSDLLQMRIEDSEHERYSVTKGDLLICEGGYPGRCAIWEQEDTIFFQKALHRVRCHNPNFNKWLLYFLYLSDKNGSLQTHFTGAGIQHFTGKALKKLALPVPQDELVSEQTGKMDRFYQEASTLEEKYNLKLRSLDELKKSILQKAFSGELTATSAKSVVA